MSSIISSIINPDLYKEQILSGSWGDCKYKFYIYKNVSFKKHKNLISVSLFDLKDIDEIYANQKNVTLNELRSEHEEKRSQYINGLNNIIKRSSDFNIRVFCDVSSIRYVEKHINSYNVEIVFYYFEQFFNKTENRHYGFFGTLMRYIS